MLVEAITQHLGPIADQLALLQVRMQKLQLMLLHTVARQTRIEIDPRLMQKQRLTTICSGP